MRLKQCVKCGATFRTERSTQAYCDACLSEMKPGEMVGERTCRQCGKTFRGGLRAWYCPECRVQRRKESAARMRRDGVKRPLGSIDHCEVCGQEYVVKAARQRYCPSCAKEAVMAVNREAGLRRYYEKKEKRKPREVPRYGEKVCVICGKPISPGTTAITCSEECHRLRLLRAQQDADIRRGKRKTAPSVKRLDDIPDDGAGAGCKD